MATSYSGQICEINSQERLSHRLDRAPTKVDRQGGVHSIASTKRASANRNIGNVAERGHRTGDFCESRVLFNILPGTKEGHRQDEASDQSQGAQQVCKMPHIQDAFSSINHQNDSQRELAGINRPQGCVLSRTNASEALQVPEICFSRENLPVQGSPLRLVNSPKGVHKGISTGGRLSTPERSASVSLSRRLSSSSKRSGYITSDNPIYHSSTTESGVSHQFQEIAITDHPEADISGDGDRYTGDNGVSTQTEGREHSPSGITVSPCRYLQEGEALFEVSRIDGLVSDDGSEIQTIHETSSDLPEFNLESENYDTGLPDYDPSQVSFNHSVVGQSEQSTDGQGIFFQETLSNTDDRCVQDSMGSTLSVPDGPGH
jgi:hypothetical protein